MSTPGGTPYQIDYSAAVGNAIRELQRQASRSGRGLAFIAAFERIIRRLQADPTRVGEPLYRLPVLRMQMRLVVIAPLCIDFAVCEDRPIVYLTSGKLLSAPDEQ